MTQCDKSLAKIAEGASPRRHAETSPIKVKDTHLMNNKLPPAEILCGDWLNGITKMATENDVIQGGGQQRKLRLRPNTPKLPLYYLSVSSTTLFGREGLSQIFLEPAVIEETFDIDFHFIIHITDRVYARKE